MLALGVKEAMNLVGGGHKFCEDGNEYIRKSESTVSVFEASGLATGAYIYQMQTPTGVESKLMTLVR